MMCSLRLKVGVPCARLIEVENRAAALAKWLRRIVSSRSSPRQRSARSIGSRSSEEPPSQLLHCPPQWQMARECYILLCEMCANINNIYSFQMVLCFVRGFIGMTAGVQEFVVALTKPEEYKGSQGYFSEGTPAYILLAPLMLYVLDSCLVVFITVLLTLQAARLTRLRRELILHCETLAVPPQVILQKTNRPGPPDIIQSWCHPVTTDSATDSSSQERPHMLSYGRKGGTWSSVVDLCHRRPIEFTARGFFIVDYTLLATMFSAITTYTIILLNQSIQRLQSTHASLP